MAKMYPATMWANTKSPGEAEVFRLLQDDPQTEDWIVLHSLNIADHLKQVSGEIDFLIVVPIVGVLCLEVKASRSLRRDGGLWYYGANAAPDARGPFRQAAEGMHSLRTKLIERDSSLSRIVFWSAVLFPYIEFDIDSTEWHPWQAIDAREYRTSSIGRIVLNVLEHARNHLRDSQSARWFDNSSEQPSLIQCRRILGLLRPDFELFEVPAARAERRETELKRFTEEQFEALDAMTENRRVLFTGPAGTGKTFLAIEAARRGRAEGRRVLLVCFNRLLGEWLRAQMRDLLPGVTTKTLHGLLLEVSGLAPGPSPTSAFWESELPERATIRLQDGSTDDYHFDELILDEAQDLFHPRYAAFLSTCLHEGLGGGRWRCFGDLERQSLFSASAEVRKVAETEFGNGARYGLRVNCRNAPRIAEYVHLLARLSPPYSHVRRPDNGIEPETKRFSSSADQQRLLTESIRALQAEGYRADEIVVLSASSEVKSIAPSLGQEWRNALSPLGALSHTNKIRCGSVFAFKGLEAPAVIVTDITSLKTEFAKDVLYVAVTRALDRLIILMREDAGRELLNLLARSGRKEGHG